MPSHCLHALVVRDTVLEFVLPGNIMPHSEDDELSATNLSEDARIDVDADLMRMVIPMFMNDDDDGNDGVDYDVGGGTRAAY